MSEEREPEELKQHEAEVYQPPPVVKKQPPPQPQGPLDVDALVIPTMAPGAGQNQMTEYPDGEDPNAHID